MPRDILEHHLGTFVEGAVGNASTAWNADRLRLIANLIVPDLLLGTRQEILRADIHIVWARWFAEAMGDPYRFPDDVAYGTIYSAALSGVKHLGLTIKSSEARHIASKVADALLTAVQRRARDSRKSLTRDRREDLLARAGDVPRCWICGYPFTRRAIALFRREEDVPVTPWRLPRFVDYLRPAGLSERDLKIEADHVVAHAHGGGEGTNLRLACGWCNRYKSDLTSVYDSAFDPKRLAHPRLGSVSRPRPFWVVRLLAVRRMCELSATCKRSADTDQMTVVPREKLGAANPCNLLVCCREHDPLKSVRLVDRGIIESSES